MKKILTLDDLGLFLMDNLTTNYLVPIYNYVKSNPHLLETIPGFLLKPEQIIFYLGKKNLAIEYIGSERLDTLENIESNVFSVKLFDFSQSDKNFLEEIVGFKYDGTTDFNFKLMEFSEDWIFPTNSAYDKLAELKWNFSAQSSILGFNGNYTISEDTFTRIVNCIFFDSDDNGLKTRHIKWMHIIPIEFNDSDDDKVNYIKFDFTILNKLIISDCNYDYYLPKDFKYKKLPQINRFIELIGNNLSSETDITTFLEKAENKFILTMAFFSKDIYPQILCEWQSQKKEKIKPDFFVLHPNGYADIVEFKLPKLKNKSVVGSINRESFSSELNSYISQTRVYKDYFDDPNNRSWFENKYGFKVYKPKRYLVIGRRWDFDTNIWKEIISDYKDIEIITYEDLIDGITAQFYK